MDTLRTFFASVSALGTTVARTLAVTVLVVTTRTVCALFLFLSGKCSGRTVYYNLPSIINVGDAGKVLTAARHIVGVHVEYFTYATCEPSHVSRI